MKIERSGWYAIPLLLGAMLMSTTPLSAQSPPATTPTVVLVNLTVRPEIDGARVMQVLPHEVRDTVKLYLDGRIEQWYGRSDGKGVVFILRCSSVAEAKELMETLPLAKAHLVNLEFTPLGPLTPLRLLVAEPAPATAGSGSQQ